MKIPLLDLKTQYRSIEKEIKRAAEEVLQSGHYILGSNVKALEEEIAGYCKVKYGVGVASGTDALRLSLIALEIGEGDEVITTPFSFIATAEVISQVGAIPVFVDIEKKTFNLDPEKLKQAITPKTRAILPVHIFGQSVNMAPLLNLAKTYSLYVIEDAAQSFGAEYKGLSSNSSEKKVGSLGDAGAFSFFPTKNLGGFGDGGMVITQSEKVAEKLKLLRGHGGNSNNYSYPLLGYNSRLDELQAAILRIKLKYVNQWITQRQKKARLYSKLLSSLPLPIEIPCQMSYSSHTFCTYTIRTPYRDRLREYLDKEGIKTKIYYPIPLHLQEIYQELGYHKGDFPVAEKACQEVLSLPIYPELKEEEINYIVDKINKFSFRSFK